LSSKLQQFIDDKWLFNSFDLSTKPKNTIMHSPPSKYESTKT